MYSEYKLLLDYNPMNLEKEVNLHISEGWQPIGGLTSTATKFDNYDAPTETGTLRVEYVQAMVKLKND